MSFCETGLGPPADAAYLLVNCSGLPVSLAIRKDQVDDCIQRSQMSGPAATPNGLDI